MKKLLIIISVLIATQSSAQFEPKKSKTINYVMGGAFTTLATYEFIQSYKIYDQHVPFCYHPDGSLDWGTYNNNWNKHQTKLHVDMAFGAIFTIAGTVNFLIAFQKDKSDDTQKVHAYIGPNSLKLTYSLR